MLVPRLSGKTSRSVPGMFAICRTYLYRKRLAQPGGETVQLGKVGIWSMVHLWQGKGDAAAELERLGFGTLWLGGSPSGDLAIAEEVLDATSTLTVATGIVNVWAEPAETVAASYHRIVAKHPDRFLLGIGASHKLMNSQYEKPYSKLV